MAYFIFAKNFDDLEGSIYRIAENQTDLNNLGIHQENYKIIEVSQSDFDSVKYGAKLIIKYNNDDITYQDYSYSFLKKEHLISDINEFKRKIKTFLNSNTNSPLYARWNDYYNQLNSLNINDIEFPLNKSLEQYFKDQNKSSLNPLQLP
jgi:hypothetical protein